MQSVDKEQAEKIGKFWDKSGEKGHRSEKVVRFLKLLAAEKRLPVRGWLSSVLHNRGGETIGWWNNAFIVCKVNERICGREVDGRSAGMVEWLKDSYGHLFPLTRGISVGCGNGSKEARFIQAGIVSNFDLWEFSEKSIEQGRSLARQLGLAHRMHFHLGNAAEEVKRPGSYDLVAWNDALHHMPDVAEALAWSRTILKPKGILAMDDFVGPTRWQWPDHQLALASAVRETLPLRYRAIPGSPFKYPPSRVERPTIAAMMERDPSEAADSDRILPALAEHFPEAVVRKTGGVVYHLAYGALHNLHPERDKNLLQLLMLLDEQCMAAGDTHYAAALGQIEK